MKPWIPHTLHVCRVAFDCRNYYGVLHLLDFGAYSHRCTKDLRESVEKLAADPPTTNLLDP